MTSPTVEPAREQFAAFLRSAFLEMQRLPHYQAAVGHRSAALADSRLVPTTTV